MSEMQAPAYRIVADPEALFTMLEKDLVRVIRDVQNAPRSVEMAKAELWRRQIVEAGAILNSTDKKLTKLAQLGRHEFSFG